MNPPVSIWNFPTRILFGMLATMHLGTEAKRLGGKHALFVTDPGVRKAGLLHRMEEPLKEVGISFSIFDGVDPNPVEKNVEEGAAAFRDANADLVIAVGGGSPLDVGKLIRLRQSHHRPLADYDDAKGGDQFISSNMPPMIAIPTTAGTGSEVGRSGVVTLDATHRKTVIFSPHLIASTAILDPAITTGLPRGLTTATGFDALTHCIEAFIAKGDHPMADAIALEGIRLVGLYLERAYVLGDDMEARGGMLKASMMGAVAFQKGLGACHSLAHPLSAEFGIHHGLANAVCLPAVLGFNSGHVGARYRRIVHALLDRDDDRSRCVELIREMIERFQMPSNLSALGVPESALDRLADLAFEDACHQSNPRPCTRDDFRYLYERSFRNG